MRPIGCTETSVGNYHSTLHKSQQSEDLIYATTEIRNDAYYSQLYHVYCNNTDVSEEFPVLVFGVEEEDTMQFGQITTRVLISYFTRTVPKVMNNNFL